MSANTSGDEIVILPVGYRQERHNDVINAYGRSFHVQLGYFLEKQDPRCVVLLGASIIPNTAGSADVSGALTTTTEKTLLAIDHGPSVSCDGPAVIFYDLEFGFTVFPHHTTLPLEGKPVAEVVRRFLVDFIAAKWRQYPTGEPR